MSKVNGRPAPLGPRRARNPVYCLLILLPILLAGCDRIFEPDEPDGPTPLAPTSLRIWSIVARWNDGAFHAIQSGRDSTPAPRTISVPMGPLMPGLPVFNNDSIATAEVGWNGTGQSFWVGAQAPLGGLFLPENTVGSTVYFENQWRFRKDSPNATFKLIIQEIFMEVYDGNGIGPSPDQCRWGTGQHSDALICDILMRALLNVSYYGYVGAAPALDAYFMNSGATAIIEGWGSNWKRHVAVEGSLSTPLFGMEHFLLDPVGPDLHQTMTLAFPIEVEFPLDSVAVGEVFAVGVDVKALAWNRRQGESYVGVYFRDPASGSGLSLAYDGVTPLAPPSEPFSPPLPPPAPPCADPGGAGGTIQFASTDYSWAEWPGDEAPIAVTRSGGSSGRASVSFATGGGTATPGSDFESLTINVHFADGEEGTRTVFLPIIADAVAEPNETVEMTLTDAAGCATLGGPTRAELTILDDDHPLPETHTIGGTVTGLEGTGLRLRNVSVLASISENGSFVFPGEYPSGAAFDVTVEEHPSDPLQTCTVANGQGVVGNADVADIIVSCETPAPVGLDPSFGTGGLARVAIVPDPDDRFAASLALAADGRILVAGSDQIARFRPDGTLDSTFGANGVTEVELATRPDDQLLRGGLAVQEDGRIVVAGTILDGINLPGNDNIALARFEADGTLDTGFGDDGLVVTDFSGRLDGAQGLLIQPDGAILVAGYADSVDQFGATDPNFALARYTTSGDLDVTFGGGDGVATLDIGGRLNSGVAVGLQSDGRIIMVGTVAATRGSDPEIGIARFDRHGVLDPSFGNEGIVWGDDAAIPAWPLGLVIDPQDRLVVAGSEGAAAWVARYDPDGELDPSFGTDGTVTYPQFLRATDLTLDTGGRIVIVGIDPSGVDFIVARLLGDGRLDPEFGEAGVLAVDFLGGSDQASAVLLQPDGRILVGGRITDGSRAVGVARVLP